MFKIFSFKFGDVLNSSNIDIINKFMGSFLVNIDISKVIENYRDSFSNENYEEKEQVSENNFIELKQYEDLYLLTIDLRGVNIRELSIKYDPGIIEVNLNRLEMKKGRFFDSNTLVKKAYNKKFENIEEIDTNQIFKSIDNEILSIIMQKKYVLENELSVVDVRSYEDNIEN